jgi:hypothetical protein
VSARVVFTRLADGTGALLDLATMEYFELNETGARIWELARDHPRDGVAARLAQEYDLDPADAEAAVTEFLAELAAAGLA